MFNRTQYMWDVWLYPAHMLVECAYVVMITTNINGMCIMCSQRIKNIPANNYYCAILRCDTDQPN